MFLLHGDAKYLDVLEQVLYNGYLSGVSLSGDRFFYQNPLESAGRTDRSAYFDVACCPANLSRLMEQIPGLLYSTRGPDLFVNLYAANTASVSTSTGVVRVKQDTKYPWDGRVALTFDVDKPRAFTLRLRVPSWAAFNGIPGGLYTFTDANDVAIPLTVNGAPVPLSLDRGFATIARTWKKGDIVRLDLPMPVRRVVADTRIAEDAGKVAIQRGPVVYALEGVDNGGKVLDVALAAGTLTHEFRPALLGGVEVVKGQGTQGPGTQGPLTFVPYYAWDNRGVGEMAVWIPTATAAARSQSTAAPASAKPSASARAQSPASFGGTSVNEGKLYSGPRMIEDRAALLQSWVEAGVPLANHTYSHIDINTVTLEQYQNDVIRGEKTYARLMRGIPVTDRWFRHPYTHTGPTTEIKAALDKFLAGRGYRVAPFTIENRDWIFSTVYAKAKAAGDAALATRTRDAYLAYSETMLDWFETLAKEDFGRDIPQILLIHSNDLHTDALDALLTRIEQRGYRFVTLGEAMKDAAYRTPDEFIGTYGPSWLHRWRVAKHLPPRIKDEPDPPLWVIDLSK